MPAMEFWLKERANPDNAIHFALNPQKVKVSAGTKDMTVQDLIKGDLPVPTGATPSTVTFAVKLLGSDRVFIDDDGSVRAFAGLPIVDWKDPQDIIVLLDNWRTGNLHTPRQTPDILTFIGVGTPILTDCYIKQFDYEIGGGYGDVDLNLTLTSYEDIFVYTDKELAQLAASTNSSGNGQTTSPGAAPQGDTQPDEAPPPTYVVQDGDYLSTIALAVYGDANRWQDIYNANVDVIGPDPNVITPGMTLVIPGGEDTTTDTTVNSDAGESS